MSKLLLHSASCMALICTNFVLYSICAYLAARRWRMRGAGGGMIGKCKHFSIPIKKQIQHGNPSCIFTRYQT